jgi:hypothetical protein
VHPTDIAILAVLESIGVVMIWRLWLRGRKTPLLARCLWTILLLIPLLGPLFYGFTRIAPKEHGEELPEYPPADGHF